ncbi:hypothetical protein Hanom_Chr14g01265531 [Helianthus anomalus]
MVCGDTVGGVGVGVWLWLVVLFSYLEIMAGLKDDGNVLCFLGKKHTRISHLSLFKIGKPSL